MKKSILILLLSFTFAAYSVGDVVSNSHQNQEFDLCYSIPGTMDNTIALGDYNGNTNGGEYNVLVIDMSATWCGPCISLIPLFDDLQQNYSNNEYVEFFVALSDLNQPYSCTQWGNMGTSGVPNIINDTGYPVFNMFNTGSSFPSLVMIDHEMRVHHKEAGYYSTFVQDASEIIDEMLFNMENSLILYNQNFLTLDENSDDGDGILNPGESFDIDFIINNNSFYLDALNVTANITNDEDIIFDSNIISFGDIEVDGSSVMSTSGTVNTDVSLGQHDFDLVISAQYIDLNGVQFEFTKTYPLSIDISLNQGGFPFDTNSEVKSSPVVVDIDNDGNKEIIFGDNNGLIHALDSSGSPIENDVFPYDTGNQIWGSPAASDIDNDGFIDIVVTSKSKHLYVLDYNGLKLDYYANKYLVGTPALGNLDDDDELEIVFGSFSSSAKVYAINIDGSDVDGFPLDLDKAQKGPALADFDGNGKDDIVIGTEDDEIVLIYDNGVVADGFPFVTGDKIRSAPSILDMGNEKIILSGSEDGNFYGINSDGSLRFAVECGEEIHTSPSFLETDQGLMIFFGTDYGTLYAIDLNGNIQPGFPVIVGQSPLLSSGAIVGSIVFEDLDSDNLAEIVIGSSSGDLIILKATDSTYSDFYHYNNVPISNVFSHASSPSIVDIDSDGDYEVLSGTTGDLVVYDIKEGGLDTDFWNVYRGNYQRTGTFVSDFMCNAGDINNDFILNILDIVSLLNIIIDNLEISPEVECAADINSDGTIDILDIVLLVNTIIEE